VRAKRLIAGAPSLLLLARSRAPKQHAPGLYCLGRRCGVQGVGGAPSYWYMAGSNRNYDHLRLPLDASTPTGDFPMLDDPFEKKPWYRHVFQRSTIVLVGCMLAALMCGTPVRNRIRDVGDRSRSLPTDAINVSRWRTQNTFDQISSQVQGDTGFSTTQINILKSCGLLGLYFTYPAGILLDHVGGFPTVVLGGAMGAVGYIGMGFSGVRRHARAPQSDHPAS